MFTRGYLKGKSGWLKMLYLLLLFFASITFSAFLASCVLQILGFETLTNPNALADHTKPGIMPALKFFQVFTSVGGFLIPPFVFAYLLDERPLDFLKLNRKTLPALLFLALLIMVSLLPTVNFLGEVNGQMNLPEWIGGSFDIHLFGADYHFKGIEQWMRDSEDQMAELTEALLAMPTIGSLFFNLFMLALLPAIGEELIFRGTIQQMFTRRMNLHVSIWLTAIIFSAIHFQFYGFLPRMFLGAVLGYLFVWSGSLWYPIMGHFVNNGSAVVLTYLIQHEAVGKDVETLGASDNTWVYALLSIAVSGVLAYVFFVRSRMVLGIKY